MGTFAQEVVMSEPCGFPIISKRTGETLAYCNHEVGHDGACSWTYAREKELLAGSDEHGDEGDGNGAGY